MLGNILDRDAENAGKSAGKSFGSNLAGKIKSAIAAAGIGKMLGSATADTCFSSDQEKAGTPPSTLIAANRRNTTSTARMQLIPWHKKVAQATPATPI